MTAGSMSRRPHQTAVALTLAAIAAQLSGCQALAPEHMLGADGPAHEHRWHQWPARVGMFVVTVPLTVVFAPLAVAEDLLTGQSLFRKQAPGVTSYMVGIPATIGAYATSLPFFLGGLPWEFEGPPPPPPPPADDDQG